MVVDELHMIRDPARGLLLELLLCKLLLSWQARGVQIIGMSATMGGALCPPLPSPGVTLDLRTSNGQDGQKVKLVGASCSMMST